MFKMLIHSCTLLHKIRVRSTDVSIEKSNMATTLTNRTGPTTPQQSVGQDQNRGTKHWCSRDQGKPLRPRGGGA